MWLSWSAAALITVVLCATTVAARRSRDGWAHGLATFTKEAAIILGLYTFWQKGSDIAVTHEGGAVGHALWVRDVERFVHLPSEVTVQRWILPHPSLVQATNAFYEIVHVPALVVFLIWLFVRHRDVYSRWRNVGAFMTGACLLIQMIPVAPPRLLPGLGFVDTAVKYGQSVYGTGGLKIAPQLAAMPSVHVGWAVLIAAAVIVASSSRYRWWVLLHPAATVFAVTATANHWWLDGIVAAALLPIGVVVVDGFGRLLSRRSRQRGDVVLVELDGGGGDVGLEVGDGAGTGDGKDRRGVGQHPGQRELAGRDSVPG